MIIPQKFKLFGRTINVMYDKSILQKDDHIGQACYKEDKIKILPNTESYKMKNYQIEQIFMHELIHFILEAMNENELRINEKFVDIFASLLHQAINTFEGELK